METDQSHCLVPLSLCLVLVQSRKTGNLPNMSNNYSLGPKACKSIVGSIPLTLSLPLSQFLLSADNLFKQFGPRSGPTKCRS